MKGIYVDGIWPKRTAVRTANRVKFETVIIFGDNQWPVGRELNKN
jgi:hypothetical protein